MQKFVNCWWFQPVLWQGVDYANINLFAELWSIFDPLSVDQLVKFPTWSRVVNSVLKSSVYTCYSKGINYLNLFKFYVYCILCWQPLNKPNLFCQRGARLGMRRAKVVADGRERLRYLATSPLHECTLKLSWPRPIPLDFWNK